MILYKIGFVARCLADYYDELCPDFICSLFSVRSGDVSDHSLLSLTGNSLRDFCLSLGNAILEAVEGVFVEELDEFIRQFFVPLEPGEESSSTVVCGRDFVNARNKTGAPPLAISRTKRVSSSTESCISCC